MTPSAKQCVASTSDILSGGGRSAPPQELPQSIRQSARVNPPNPHFSLCAWVAGGQAGGQRVGVVVWPERRRVIEPRQHTQRFPLLGERSATRGEVSSWFALRSLILAVMVATFVAGYSVSPARNPES